MDEHFDALEADFERYYGLDLLDVYRGTLPAQKAANLAANLPAGALTWQVLEHPNAWTTGEYIAAAQVDALNWSNWIAGGGKGEKPKPMETPMNRKTKKKRSSEDYTANAVARFLENRKLNNKE